MVLQLILNKDGNYEYQDARVNKTPVLDTTAFEAYEAGQKTTLAGETDIGSQTKQLMRETPGQYSTTFNEQTGQFETRQQDSTPVTVDVGTINQTKVKPPMTALDQISRITSGTKPSSIDTSEVAELLRNQQKLQQRAQTFDQITKVADMGFRAYNMMSGKGMSIPGTTGNVTPLKAAGSMPIGQSTLGGVGAAGSIAYGVGTMFKVKPKERTGMTAGASIGMAAGGPVGAVIGGVIGGVLGCFLPDTEITMADGSKKKIIDIELKDNIKIGGNVFATAKFLITNLYDYKGVKVSGSHMVNENNKWIRVEDSNIAKSLGNDEHVVYTLGTQNRRIVINDILFTDYFEIDEKEELVKQGDSYFDNWKLHSNYLSEQNVYKINEKQTLELR